ncbi:MAG: heme iron utilization protein, partial [Eubacteriales bacterium]|nr:heme iron utilization protein [Eubacteriales bacterium]
KNASLMIIEDETNSKILFARKRLTFKGTATKVLNISEEIKKAFEEIHSKQLMETLYKMDFDFFEIQIEEGRLVEGFGKAFKLTYNNGDWAQEHIVIDKAHND